MSLLNSFLCLSIGTCAFLLALTDARAQRDTVEFKLIPKYYSQENMGSGTMTELDTSVLIFKPSIDFPSDPKLQGTQARVTVNVLVDTQGFVRNARVIKSTNKAFNKYALKYAKQYRFKLPKEVSKGNEAWIAMPIYFKQSLSVEFRQLAEQWRLAYNDKDAKTMESMYTEDAEYISAHVAGYIAHGRDRVIANFLNGANSGGYIDTVEVMSVNSSCDMATLVTRYVGIAGGNKVNGRNLLVCKRIDGKWLIVTHMTVVRD